MSRRIVTKSAVQQEEEYRRERDRIVKQYHTDYLTIEKCLRAGELASFITSDERLEYVVYFEKKHKAPFHIALIARKDAEGSDSHVHLYHASYSTIIELDTWEPVNLVKFQLMDSEYIKKHRKDVIYGG